MLSKSIRRVDQYQMGGITVVLGFATRLANGVNALTITRGADGKSITGLALAAGHPVVRLEFDENEALFSDNTTIGANRFPKHQLGMKFNGRDADKNAVIEKLDLTRNTFLVRLQSGQTVLLGGVNGLIAEKSDSGAGAKLEDFNGYDVLLSGGELEKAPVVPDAEFVEFSALVAA
ncbi:MAG TPA: hypothetical protein VF690_01225 [Hymenobacter sp.]|jgi:hypothetical protein